MAKILIIDDEEQLRKLLARIIALEGYEVAEAADCAGGLRMLRRYEPDVVLCDVKLPDGNGVEMVGRIKQAMPSAETNAPFARGLAWWMACAKTSLPVPVSPVSSTEVSVTATLRASATALRRDSDEPMKAGHAFGRGHPADGLRQYPRRRAGHQERGIRLHNQGRRRGGWPAQKPPCRFRFHP